MTHKLYLLAFIVLFGSQLPAKQVLFCKKENNIIYKTDIFGAMSISASSSWKIERTGEADQQGIYYLITGLVKEESHGFHYYLIINKQEFNIYISNRKILREKKIYITKNTDKISCYIRYSSDNNFCI